MAKLFRNYNTLTEYEADTNKPVNTVCFIKDAKVIYVDGIQYSYKQLDYLPPAINEAEALEYMGKIIKNAQEVGLIHLKPVPTIYWAGDSNTVSINYNDYTAESDNITIDGIEYYQLKLDKDLNNDFYNFSNNTFTNLIFKDVDNSKVTDMNQMFYWCNNLTSLDLSKFDTSNVTNMNSMFYYCSDLTSLDVSKFNTSNVTNMNSMFEECSSLTSLDLGGWNTSNVNYIGSMFGNCSALTSLDMSGWDTSNVIYMSYMFHNCSALKTIRMVGCSQTTIDNIKSGLSLSDITDCTIVTE